MTGEQIAELRKGYEERSREDLDAEADEVLRLLDEREALLAALKGVEWGGDSFQGFAAVCPECVAHEGKPHEPDCALAVAIAKAEAP